VARPQSQRAVLPAAGSVATLDELVRAAMKDEDFAQAQHRRAQTEARIAIFKNEFLGRPMRSEGFKNRALQVAWGVLTHDLWVLAEKLREQRKMREQKLRKAA
jgi:hypothetical protein